MSTENTNRIITINLPAEDALVATSQSILASAESYLIDCPEVYEIAASELKTIKSEMGKLEEERKKHVSPLNDEVKFINDLFKQGTNILAQAETIIKGKLLTYQQEENRKAAEERARAEAAAEIERKRLAAEAQAAKESGDETTAAVLEATSQVVTAPVMTAPRTKVSGISTRTTWSAEVTSLIDLVKHVAANPDQIGLIEANMKALNGMAKALKENLHIPGVKSVSTQAIAAGSR